MLYNIVYGFTWGKCLSLHRERTFSNVYTGPMPWLLPAEIFPLRSRSKGMALATVRSGILPSKLKLPSLTISQASNWIFNFIIGMVSPDAFAGIHGYFYLIIAGFCLFSAGLAYFYYVETAGHTLE